MADRPGTQIRPPSRRELRIGSALAVLLVLSALTMSALGLALLGGGSRPQVHGSNLAPMPPNNLARGVAFSP